MSAVSDEMLMAYADGELSASDRRRVEEALAGNQAVSQRLEIFAKTNGLLRSALGDAASVPIPDRLLDTVLGVVPPAAVAAPVRRPLPQRASLLSQIHAFLLPLTPAHAVGAAAALLFVGVVDTASRHGGFRGQGAAQLVVASGGKLLAQGSLQRVLDGSPSGMTVAFSAGQEAGSIKPILTFKRHDGQHCRIYQLDHASGAAANGVGCRNPSGQWSIEVHSGAVVAAKPQPGQIVPASGSMSPAVDAAVDRMISGDAFGAEQEAKLMTNQWRP
jgi:surface antigen